MAEQRDYPLQGWTLERVTFDFETALLFLPVSGSTPSCVVTLMGTFSVEQPGSPPLALAAGPPFAHADALLALHREPLAQFSASSDGMLLLRFEDDRTIQAGKDSQYESWSVDGPVKLLCSPHDGPPWGLSDPNPPSIGH